MRLRPVAILAILAALLGAPLSVLGAGSGLVHPGSTSSADSTGTVEGIAGEPVATRSVSADGWTPVVVVGLTGIGVMAAAGTGLLVASRRRRRAGGTGSADSPATAPHPDDRVEQLLQRRSLRRARARLTEDPIVAALGLGDSRDDERRRRRGNVESTAPNRQVER